MPGVFKFRDKTSGREYSMPWDNPSTRPTEGQKQRHIFVTEEEMSLPAKSMRAVKETAESTGITGAVSKALKGPKLPGLGTALTEGPVGRSARKLYDWSAEQISPVTDPRTYTAPAAERLRKAGTPEEETAFEVASRLQRPGGEESPFARTSRRGVAGLTDIAGEVGSMATTPAGALDIAGLAAAPFTGGASALPAAARWTARGASLAGRLGGAGQAIHGASKVYNEPTWGGKALGAGEALLGAYGAGRGSLGGGFRESIRESAPTSAWPRTPKGLPAYEPPPPGPFFGGRQGVSRNLEDLTEVDLAPASPERAAFEALIPERYKPTVLQPENISRTVEGAPAGPLVPKRTGERFKEAPPSETYVQPGEAAPYKPTTKWPKKPTPTPTPAVSEVPSAAKRRLLSADEVGDVYGEPLSRALKNKRVKSAGKNKYGVEVFEAVEEPITIKGSITPEGLRPRAGEVGDVSEIPATAKPVGVGSTKTPTTKGPTAPSIVAKEVKETGDEGTRYAQFRVNSRLAGQEPLSLNEWKAAGGPVTPKDIEGQRWLTTNPPMAAPTPLPTPKAPKYRKMTDRETEIAEMADRQEAAGKLDKAKATRDKLRQIVGEEGGEIEYFGKKGAVSPPSTAKDKGMVERFLKEEKGELNVGELAKGTAEAAKWISKNKRGLWNLPRGLQSAGDLSALRQAFPLIHKAKYWKNMGPMVKAAASQDKYDDYMLDMLTHPNYKKAQKAGLAVSERLREEDRLSDLIDKLPGYKQSNRAFSLYLKKTRLEEFNDLVAKAEKKAAKVGRKGGTAPRELSDDDYRKIAKYVNDATGRGRLPALEDTKVAGLASDVLYSPRLFTSRMSYYNPMNYLDPRRMPAGLRMERAKSAAAMAGATTGAQYLGEALGGKTETTDPTSTDYGKLRFGNLRIDPGAGFQQPYVLGRKLASGGYTNPTTGVHKMYGKGYGAKTVGDEMINFISSKLNPVPGTLWDLATASEYRPFNPADRALRLPTPLTIQDASELLQDNPAQAGALIPAFFGLGGLQQFDKFGEGTLFPKSVTPDVFRKELVRPQFWQKDAWRKTY
jgi:hypothetical protein